MLIQVYNQGFSVTPASGKETLILRDFTKQLAIFELKKVPPYWRIVKIVKDYYVAYCKPKQEFNFPIGRLPELEKMLRGNNIVYSKNINKPPKGAPADMKSTGVLVPRDYQEDPVDNVLNSGDTLKILEIQTGKGKTAMSLISMIRFSKRTLIQLRGGYVERWLVDLSNKKLFNLKPGCDIVVIGSSKSLISIINQAKAIKKGREKGKLPSIIIITNKIMYNLMKEWEQNGKKSSFGIHPRELYSLLGIGMKIIDEAHEDKHMNFRSMAYTNVELCVPLTATIMPESDLERNIMDGYLPVKLRYNKLKYDAYTHAVAVFYKIDEKHKIKYSEAGKEEYSHNKYELSIMEKKVLFQDYLEMLFTFSYRKIFNNDYRQGHVAIYFMKRTDLCAAFAEYLKRKLKEKGKGHLRVNFFISETEEKVLYESDVIVTTTESCGTAKDIPNIKDIFCIRAVGKKSTNEQIKGRARPIKISPDVEPTIYYFVDTNNPKHLKYHEKKIEAWTGRVKTHKVENLGLTL